MNYLLHILTMVMIYIILGSSLNLVVGFGGKLSLCHGAFYGIGAYAYSLLVVSGGIPFWIAMPVAVLLTGLSACIVAAVALRMNGDFFALATLGFQTIVFTLLYNWVSFTKGPYGIAGIPRPEFLGLTTQSAWAIFLVAAALAALVLRMSYLLAKSPYGRTLQAVRDDSVAAQSLGKSPTEYLLTSFTLAGGLAAFAGATYAAYATFIDPTSFTLDESVFILCAVVIGGAGTVQGPVVGATILVLLPEALRFLGLPDAISANLRQIIYGLLLVLMMRYRPQGIAGQYAFD